jgi:hypothetical protein
MKKAARTAIISAVKKAVAVKNERQLERPKF